MVPAEAVQQAASEARQQQAAQTQLEGLAEEAKDAAQAEAEQDLKEKVQAMLPKQVVCVVGTVSYDAFKKRYASVYEQVSSKEYLLSGRVTYRLQLGSFEYVLRSLKSRERNELAALQTDANIVNPEYTRAVLAAGIESIAGQKFPAVKLQIGGYDDWIKSAHVKKVIDWLDEADETLVELLMGVHLDMQTAKMLALREDLKNL